MTDKHVHTPVMSMAYAGFGKESPVVVQVIHPYATNAPGDDTQYTFDALVCSECGSIYVEDPKAVS